MAVDRSVMDSETRLTDEDHLALRVWLRLLASANLIQTAVRSRLQTQFEITLPRFDLMSQLDRAPNGLKMSELSRRMMVTGGNVTGIADGLEDEGLIVRAVDPEDGRAFRVKLTREGRKAFARMAQEHEQWIIEMFGDVSNRDQKTLMELLGRLKSSVTSANKAE
jgi:DNA-binding MarR family transcriptional regulator